VPRFPKILAPLVLLLAAHAAVPQTELEAQAAAEAIKQEAFRQGMTDVVGSLNSGSYVNVTRALDRDDFVDRIFGLRLIDGTLKRDFRDDMKEPDKWNGFVESLFQDEAEKGIRGTLLLVESRGDRGRAVVRYDMSFFRANYHEYDLRLDSNGHMYIIDWKDYYWGHTATDRIGLMLVQARPNENAARKLVSLSNAREPQIFQVMEILKATRDRDFNRFTQIMEAMDEKLRKEPSIVKLGLDTARAARKRRVQRDMLTIIDENYADDPLFAQALMDLYLPAKRYQDALDTLDALGNHLRIDDALIKARKSSILLAMEQVEDAHALAMESVEQEPGLELGWWSVLRARVTAENYGSAIEALEVLEDDFDHSLGPDALSKDPMFRPLMLSAEYRTWFEESD
jgi:tetratricopeptide (TPR) repeat protein